MPVVNLNKESYDVFIGRGSMWGNPFKIGKDGTRSEVIEKYRDWITNSMDEEARKIRSLVHTLRGKTLGCYCKPKACHGDILMDMAEATSLTEFFEK